MKRESKFLMKMTTIKTSSYYQKRIGKREPSVVTSIKIKFDKDEVGVKEEVEMVGSKATKIKENKVCIKISDILNAITVKNMDIMNSGFLRRNKGRIS